MTWAAHGQQVSWQCARNVAFRSRFRCCFSQHSGILKWPNPASASIGARLSKAYIATRAASIANARLTSPLGGGWMQPHFGANTSPMGGQLQPEQLARHPATFASRRPRWWDDVPRCVPEKGGCTDPGGGLNSYPGGDLNTQSLRRHRPRGPVTGIATTQIDITSCFSRLVGSGWPSPCRGDLRLASVGKLCVVVMGQFERTVHGGEGVNTKGNTPQHF